VAPNENLTLVARQYGVSVADIERANPGLNARRIQVGQSIRVPGANGAAAQQPATSRPAPAPEAGAATQTPAAAQPATARTHTIRSGDTLDGIARRYGTSVSALQEANPDLDPRRLIPGRSIRIP